MPFDNRGNFTRLHNWEDDRINDIEIVTDHMDEEDNNFADGLSQCFLKNGLSKMQNDFDAGNFKLRNVANGTTSLDAVNKSQLDTLSSSIAPSLVPTGTILPYGGSTAPRGYLLCNGSAVSRTTYSDLFAVIGTTYGTGDSSTTFNLPDCENIVTDVNTNVPVKGTGESLGMTDGTNNFGTTQSLEAGAASARAYGPSASAYGANVGGSDYSRSSGKNRAAIGVTTDATKSGIVGTVTRVVLTCKHIIKY